MGTLGIMPRPAVTVGRHLYEIVEPAHLRALVAEILAEFDAVFGPPSREQLNRLAHALLAAAVNALQEWARDEGGRPRLARPSQKKQRRRPEPT